MTKDLITSVQNPRIKDLLSLQEKSRSRRQKGLFVVEGRREFLHCLEGGYVPEGLFICDEIIKEDEKKEILDYSFSSNPSLGITYVSKTVYSKIAYREGTEGIIAEVRVRNLSLKSVSPSIEKSPSPLVIVLEGVEKPGNLGAILRSADAAGADGVLVCDPLCDIYNPNLIRASIGAVFTLNIAVCSDEEAISYLLDKRYGIYTAQLQDSLPYYDAPMTGSTALVMGTESVGLSNSWRKVATRHIRIPMLGKLDSLNVSVSAAILLFEAVRQRTAK